MDKVFVTELPAPPVDIREILRYAGIRENSEEYGTVISELLKECENLLSYKVCAVKIEATEQSLLSSGFTGEELSILLNHFSDCAYIVFFAATVGAEIERLFAKYRILSPSRALLLSAIGTERVEALCDSFCEKLKVSLGKDGLLLKERRSPGYKPFPLEMQRSFFSLLDCQRKIGISLGESLLMSPTKSVTAMIGAYKPNP